MTMDGLDRLFSGLRVSSSGLMAERTRIDVIAENIANARTTRTPEGGPYRRKMVVFEPVLARSLDGVRLPTGVGQPRVVADDRTPYERIVDPGNPDADENGVVTYPNVNAVLEMTDLITAMRAYEANLVAQESFVQIAERALELAR
jgi:flagellar basal-body rod protein FlgC